MNTLRKIIVVIILSVFIATSWGQTSEEQTRFTRDSRCFKRYTTTNSDKRDGIFLPQFQELVSPLPNFKDFLSNPDREILFEKKKDYAIEDQTFKKIDVTGDKRLSDKELTDAEVITLKDWYHQYLPAVRFLYLDQKQPYGVVTKDELANDSREIMEEESPRYGISQEVFQQLDGNKDKKLSREELSNVVTLKDWQKYFLTQERFIELDQKPPYYILSLEEINADSLQGQAVVNDQGKEILEKYLKNSFANYEEKLTQLQNKGYTDILSTQCIVSESGKELNKRERCEVDGNIPWAKIYVEARAGRQIDKKVNLGYYNLLLLQDQHQEEENSYIAYIAMAIFVGIIIVTVAFFSLLK